MAAVEQFEHRDEVAIAHRAFELDPTTPSGETTPVLDHLASKFGSTDRVMAGEQRLIDLTAEIGLAYRIDRLHGNTFDAHRLVAYGSERDLGDETVAALYRTNFAEGRSIFDADALTAVATEVGLDTGETAEMLASDAYSDRVREDERLAAGLGIQGVPFFVIDRTYGISGAQPTDALVTVLDRVWRERPGA
jgi:predicted DsbA family dithiol-disulfide isomerase